MKSIHTICIFFCLSAVLHSQTQTLYLSFDPNFMKRLDYQFRDRESNVNYTSFSIPAKEGGTIYLEIGIENDMPLSFVPQKLVDSRTANLSRNIIDDINKNKIRAYIVRLAQEGYLISPIGLATYFSDTNNSFAYESIDTKFRVNKDSLLRGFNLADPKSPSNVSYLGNYYLDGVEAFEFKKSPVDNSKPYTDFVIIPALGVTEEKTGVSPSDAENNVLGLSYINGIAFSEYLGYLRSIDSLSRVRQIDTTYVYRKDTLGNHSGIGDAGFSGSEPFESDVPSSRNVISKPKPPIAAPVNNNCPEKSSDGIHVVQSSETLFGIARQYGITTRQLRDWNHLENDIIQPCSKLKVKAPDAYYQPEQTPATNPSNAITEKQPAAPVVEKTTPKTPVVSTWKQPENDTHIVKAGETLNSIAKKYGYSVERYAAMNGLNVNASLSIGQALKTSDCVCPVPSTSPASFAKNQPESQKVLVPKGKIHVVAQGETLYSISKKYNTTVDKIRALNNMEKSEVVIPFQKIYVE